MKVIKIQGSENKHVEYLFNKVMPIMKNYGCGGKYETQSGNIEMKVCSEKALEQAKKLFNEFKIKFKELIE